MSITDSSTSLDLTYTEQSLVSFSSGVLSTLSTCVTEVESKLQVGTLSASTTPTLTQVQNWLKRAKMELSEIRRFDFRRRYATASTTAGTYRYALPPDYNGGLTKIRDVTNDRSVTIWPQPIFDMKYPDPSYESNSKYCVATIKNMEMWLAPPPDGTYSYELEYDRAGAETDADDFSWLPEMERFRCCDFATKEAFEALHDFNKASVYAQKWGYGLQKAVKADGKRRWRDMQYQAISFMQQRSLMNNQGS